MGVPLPGPGTSRTEEIAHSLTALKNPETPSLSGLLIKVCLSVCLSITLRRSCTVLCFNDTFTSLDKPERRQLIVDANLFEQVIDANPFVRLTIPSSANPSQLSCVL